LSVGDRSRLREVERENRELKLSEARSLPHYTVNVGVRLNGPGLTIAYTGDTGPDPALADLGRDADLFIVDATDRHPAAQRPGH